MTRLRKMMLEELQRQCCFLLNDIVKVAERVTTEPKHAYREVGPSVLPLLVQVHRDTRPAD